MAQHGTADTADLPAPTAGTIFRYQGCDIETEDPINGFYIQQPEERNSRPYFVRQSLAPDSDPMVIWWLPKRTLWMVNNRSQMETENAKAVVRLDVAHPEEILTSGSEASWFVFHPSEGGFSDMPSVKFARCTPQEEKQERQATIKVTGRKGYNRAMNGVYRRGPQPWGGKSYYRHENNNFTIRWFETKWVVDWRDGLHNDNVGAAVCKEHVPEPWMATCSWRVYDGKARGDKKWKYDPEIKILPEAITSNNFVIE